jgi:methylmalonyl-CoA mutase N-terminal domain/subunit
VDRKKTEKTQERARKPRKPSVQGQASSGKSRERRDRFATLSDLPIDRIYRQTRHGELGQPGQFPFTRGVYPTMYRGRLWTMRQYSGYATARETNRRFRYLLEQGQTGLSVAFDLPTQIGYDSDHPMADGEVGRTGVAIDTLADLEVLFEDIPLDRVSTSMTINSTAAVLLAMYMVLAEKRGLRPDTLSGTIQNDILKEYIARGTYIFPPKPSLRLITDIFTYCHRHMPRWNTISISGYHIREAGSTAVQEVAFTLANGIAYVQAALDVGLKVDDFAPRLSFFFNAHNDFFEEVAKFRAARRLWATVMKERFGAEDPASLRLRFHTQTAGCSLTAQQPENNIVRVTLQALAAVLGGTQSLHTNSYDEALCLPTEKAVQIALRTQQLIAAESGVPDTVDPMGGAYYLEYLTDEIERRVQEYLEAVDQMGGALQAVERGYFQTEIQKSAYRYQRQVESGERTVVGVNQYVVDGGAEPDNLLRVDPAIQREQIRSLSEVKARRDQPAVDEALKRLRAAAEGSDNLMPPIMDCVRRSATLGEICDVLRDAFGEYREKVVVS